MIREGHSMGVATDIRIDLLGASQRLFGIDDPLLAPEFIKQSIEGGFFI